MLYNKNTVRIIQQGDVMIIPIESLPINAKIVNRNGILVEGEHTGNFHKVCDTDLDYTELLQVCDEKDGDLFLKADKEITIVHPEHGQTKVPEGIHKIERVQEFDYDKHEARNVAD